ncbi:MAG: CsbD family protein [Acetobacter sp.]|nr:CsbD family protein [Acetobacter sp.]MCH4062400.1 CsbD family protein [Acetobacter sp.]MCH4088753.1 CsbD family protein [Acetobacter sp.]MCI1292658.1 CsbD family protein [Acetobacter sp.]MCI1319242.1 CsbD family protein [Acetobacter sp.]
MSEEKKSVIAEKAQGAFDQAKGRVKDAAGGLTGDIGLQAEGKVDQLSGMAREEFADLYQESEGLVERALTFVHDKPLASLGIASVLGLFIGWLLMPRSRK